MEAIWRPYPHRTPVIKVLRKASGQAADVIAKEDEERVCNAICTASSLLKWKSSAQLHRTIIFCSFKAYPRVLGRQRIGDGAPVQQQRMRDAMADPVVAVNVE
eukprot:7014399-Prymnesium_polylepis.1